MSDIANSSECNVNSSLPLLKHIGHFKTITFFGMWKNGNTSVGEYTAANESFSKEAMKLFVHPLKYKNEDKLK